jgi:tryptophan-rich sensory protein
VPIEVPSRSLLIAVSLTLTAGLLEGLAAGRDVRGRLAEIRLPGGSPPLALWIGVALLYYATSFIIAVRLLRAGPLHGPGAVAFGLLVALLLTNALWNATFFRRRDLRLSWWVALIYASLALALAIALWRADPVALCILVPYLLYLIYGTWWVYAVWQLDVTRRAA